MKITREREEKLIVSAWYEMVSVWYEMVSAWYEIVSAWYEMVSAWHEMVSAWHEMVSAWYEMVSAWYEMVSAWYEMVSAWYEIVSAEQTGNTFVVEMRKHMHCLVVLHIKMGVSSFLNFLLFTLRFARNEPLMTHNITISL